MSCVTTYVLQLVPVSTGGRTGLCNEYMVHEESCLSKSLMSQVAASEQDQNLARETLQTDVSGTDVL